MNGKNPLASDYAAGPIGLAWKNATVQGSARKNIRENAYRFIHGRYGARVEIRAVAAITGRPPGYDGICFFETSGNFGFIMKARMKILRTFGQASIPPAGSEVLTGIQRNAGRMLANAR